MGRRRLKRAYIKILKKIKFGNMALRKKMLFVHILLLIIPLLLLYYYVIGIYIDGKKDEVINSISQVNHIAMSNIDNYIQQIQELTKQPLYDKYVLSTLIENDNYKQEFNQLMEKTQNSTAAVESSIHGKSANGFIEDGSNSVSSLVNRIMAFNSYIHSVFIVDLSGKYIYRIVDNGLVKPYSPANEEWYKRCMEMKGKPIIVSSFNFNEYIEKRGEAFFVFSVARAIKNPASTETIGTIIININESYLESVCSSIRSVEGERILILDAGDNIVYDSVKSNIAGKAGSEAFDLGGIKQLDFDKKFNDFQFQMKRYIVLSAKSGITDWRLIRLIPEDRLYSDVWMIRTRLTVLLILFVMFSLVLSIFIAYGVTKPLNKLIRTMKAIEKGDLSLRFKVRHKDEVGQLGRSFNKMINRIDNLVNTVYVSRLRKREAELHALQAQINPHFIYNTMEAIRMMAKLNGDSDTSEMALILGKLLRYSINIKNKIVTVKEEVEHLKNYLVIQNYRFDNKFELILNIAEELYDMKIIKLIFQPVVENAIYHGLETSSLNGVIRIDGYKTENSVTFDIEDNGAGMTVEELEELNRKVNDFSVPEGNHGGIGLRNINERLKLHFGEEYGLTILSGAVEGTTVRINLPKEKGYA